MNKLIAILLLFCTPVFGQTWQTWPEVRVAAHTSPPFQFKYNGEMRGPFMRIMDEVCAEAKIHCTVDMGAFKDQYKKVIEGDADIIFTFLLDASDERNALFHMSVNMVDTWYSFFTTSTSQWKWTGDVSDLNGRTIGVYGPSGTSYVAQQVIKGSNAVLVMEPTNLVVFQQLIVGKYGERAAIVANKDVGLAFLKSANISGPKPAGDIVKTSYGFAFYKQSPRAHLAPRMLEAAARLKRNGVIQKILTTNDPPLEPSE